jgi:DNA-directed RNA polymerase specialized sigma24 family protein
MADLAPIQIGNGRPPLAADSALGERISAAPAFSDLVEAWQAPLYRFAYGLTGDPGEAARLTHFAFRRWLERTDRRARSADGPRWLFATLHREFARTAGPGAADFAAGSPDASASFPCVGAADVVAALQQVGVPARVPLALMYAGNFTAAEIAATLDQPLPEVLARLASGKIQLVRALQRPAAAQPPAAG